MELNFDKLYSFVAELCSCSKHLAFVFTLLFFFSSWPSCGFSYRSCINLFFRLILNRVKEKRESKVSKFPFIFVDFTWLINKIMEYVSEYSEMLCTFSFYVLYITYLYLFIEYWRRAWVSVAKTLEAVSSSDMSFGSNSVWEVARGSSDITCSKIVITEFVFYDAEISLVKNFQIFS